jgi:hypothetical protein
MRGFRLRLCVTAFLLLGFAGIFTHELLPGHGRQSGEACEICVQWSQQVAVEGHTPDLPKVPDAFELGVPAPARRPEHLFEVLSQQRGPPPVLPVL